MKVKHVLRGLETFHMFPVEGNFRLVEFLQLPGAFQQKYRKIADNGVDRRVPLKLVEKNGGKAESMFHILEARSAKPIVTACSICER